MEIHKPKAVHSWRELLREVGVIVIGVLIALAAEQMVQAFHWRERVGNTEARLRKELENVRFAARERLAVRACLDRRIDQLEARVLDASGPLTPEPYWLKNGDNVGMGAPYRAPIRAWESTVWRAANADGTATHLAPERMLNYAEAYEQVEMIRAENGREFDATSRLGALQRGVTLSAADKAHLVEVLEELRRDNALVALQSGQILGLMKANGVTTDEIVGPGNSATYKSCQDLGLLR